MAFACWADAWNSWGLASGGMIVSTSAASPSRFYTTSPRMFVVTTTAGTSVAEGSSLSDPSSDPHAEARRAAAVATTRM